MLKNAGIKVYSNLIAMLHTGSQSSGSIHPSSHGETLVRGANRVYSKEPGTEGELPQWEGELPQWEELGPALHPLVEKMELMPLLFHLDEVLQQNVLAVSCRAVWLWKRVGGACNGHKT